ncbi:hypothetical protein BDV93DRAFT_516415 [Ceratobasidium sp. AG-I]|nr:hypothetical protein BDV93DRAFT_516415 [Ceratobasidium sp. AG-I]
MEYSSPTFASSDAGTQAASLPEMPSGTIRRRFRRGLTPIVTSLGLPGFSELNTVEVAHEERELINIRVQHLMDALSGSGLPGSEFAEAATRRSKYPIIQIDRPMEELRWINMEINQLIETFNMRLVEGTYQKMTHMEENGRIEAHKILRELKELKQCYERLNKEKLAHQDLHRQVLAMEYSSITAEEEVYRYDIVEEGGVARLSKRRGSISSFSLQAPVKAELIECEIAWHTSYCGPNLSKFIGRIHVDGVLRGVASTTGQMSCKTFLQRTCDRAKLAKFRIQLQGIKATMQLTNSPNTSDEVEVTVDISGQVTILPPESRRDFNHNPFRVLSLPLDKNSYHPAVLATIKAHMSSKLWYTKQHDNFIARIRDGDFTPLAVLAAAKSTYAVPSGGGGGCLRNSPPPILCENNYEYKVLRSYHQAPVQPYKVQYCLEGHISHLWESLDANSSWKQICDEAGRLAESVNMDLGSNVEMTITLTNKIPVEKYLPYRVYFHHHPNARSNPREFWGFISANPNPRVESVLLEELGWQLHYDL